MRFMQTESVLQTKNRSRPAKIRFSVALFTMIVAFMGITMIVAFLGIFIISFQLNILWLWFS